jgi:hypothetical protein
MQILNRSEMKNIMAGSDDCYTGDPCACTNVYGCYATQCASHADPQGCLDEVEDLWLECEEFCNTIPIGVG